MNNNISFYSFMHKQILVVLMLFIGTGPSYIVMGSLYESMSFGIIWYFLVLIISMFGYKYYKQFPSLTTLKEKDTWLLKVRIFMFIYFSMWSVAFIYYVLSGEIQQHYMTIGAQFGTAVVASTILASQKHLVIATVVSLMTPIFIYFVFVGEVYSYILAFFTIVLSLVLLYAAKNTFEYLVMSRYQAYHDYLTSLGNRRYFIELLDSSIIDNKGKFTYVLLIDLDYFKTINDTLGHDVGDKLLCEVSRRMQELSLSHSSYVARLGGDEFSILSQAYPTYDSCIEAAEEFSNELLNEIKRTYIIDNDHLYISASIGVSIINNPQLHANDFLKEADIAMYEAKNNGRDGVMVFNEGLAKLIEEKLEIERLLHFAIEANEISLVYQPQLDRDEKIIGCEVLVRWNNNKLGFVSPAIFIPIAENTGYILELGVYILESAFKTLNEWSKGVQVLEQFSINISVRQLLHKDFVTIVENMMKKYISSECKTKIIFEITETSTTKELDKLVLIINELKKYNISFSMDDFGTGYSSLSYLRDIPIDELKIDKLFVSELRDEKQASLVKSIIDISKNLNLKIVAEGVEEKYQQKFLKEQNCDFYQGYLFSKPVSKIEFEKLLKSS